MKLTDDQVRTAYGDRDTPLAVWAGRLGCSTSTLVERSHKLGMEMRLPQLSFPRPRTFVEPAPWTPPAWAKPAAEWSEARREAERRLAEHAR